MRGISPPVLVIVLAHLLEKPLNFILTHKFIADIILRMVKEVGKELFNNMFLNLKCTRLQPYVLERLLLYKIR